MPILNLKITGTPNPQLAQNLAVYLTDITEKYLKKKPELTAVSVQFIPDNQWFIHKKSLESLNQQSFYLDIKVTESTNLKDEKSAFIQAVFSKMNQVLENVHSESYVYVEEVKADAYGFGGLTQEYRYIK